MTPPLRDAFERMLADEPPLDLTVDDVVRRGQRRQAGRRRAVGLAAAVALVAGLGLAVVATNLPSGTDETPAAPTTTTPPSTTSAPATTTTTTTTTTTAPRPEEQLPDPGFEAATLGWSTFGPATTLRSVDTARSGDHALEVSSTVTVDDVAGATNRPVLVRTTAGQRYRATCWVRSAQPITAHVQVQEYTTDWQRAGDPAPSDRVTLADPDRWYQLSVTYTAAHTGNQLPLTVFSTKLRPGGPTLLVDDCSLTVSSR